MALCLALALPLQAGEADEKLTTAEVTELAQILEALVLQGGDLPEAEAQGRQLLDLTIRDFGTESREALQVELPILLALQAQTKHDEYIPLSRYSLDRAIKLLRPDDPLLYRFVSIYALALLTEDEAESALGLLAEAIGNAETRLAADDIAFVELRLVQAIIAVKTGQTGLAEATYAQIDALLKDKEDAQSKALRVTALQGWAMFMAEVAPPAEAIAVLQAAIAALEDQWKDSKHSRMVPLRLQMLALLCDQMILAGQRPAVVALLRPELAEVEAVFGRDSPQWADLATRLASGLAGVDASPPALIEARDLMAQAVAVMELAYSPDIVALLDARVNYAVALTLTGDMAGALAQIRALNGAARATDRAALTFVLHSAQEAGLLNEEQAVEAILTLLQESQRSGAGAAQRVLAARLAAGSGEAARLLREKSDLSGMLKSIQIALAALTAAPVESRDSAAIAELRSRLGETMRALTAAEDRLEKSHPELAAVTAQMALPLAEIRRRLGPDAALVLIDPPVYDSDPGLVVAVSQEAVEWHSFQVPGAEIAAAIRDLRAGIDLRLGLRSAAALDGDAAPMGFDLAQAHWLYGQLAGQVDSVFAGKRLIYFDLRGEVSALPPQLMVMTPPLSDDLAKADWLIRHHAVAILPAISALPDRALPPVPPAKTLLAFANPEFASLSATAPTALRGSLAPLPETATEATEVALALGAASGAVRLGAAASEAAVKTATLANVGMLYFATHGLVSGDQVGAGALDEPALALTPGQGEDGFLTASEIAELRLNAGLVVLSACNTAAGDAPGADALSGLAQSFLYAGARGLLVSHWPVESHSAVALMTDLFRLRAEEAGVPVALAQQKAILRMIDSPADPRWSHPAYWAPFVVVGSPE